MENLQPCILSCAESARGCREAAAEAFKSPPTTEVGRLCLDNAALCDLTIEVLARASAHHGDFCTVNAHINRVCAAALSRILDQNELFGRCQEACLACAAECDKHAPHADI